MKFLRDAFGFSRGPEGRSGEYSLDPASAPPRLLLGLLVRASERCVCSPVRSARGTEREGVVTLGIWTVDSAPAIVTSLRVPAT
jgi:hypothetical protein